MPCASTHTLSRPQPCWRRSGLGFAVTLRSALPIEGATHPTQGLLTVVLGVQAPGRSTIMRGLSWFLRGRSPTRGGQNINRGCWHRVSRYLSPSGRRWALELYDSSAFFAHGAWLDQAFAHCQILSTAAAKIACGPCLSATVAGPPLRTAKDQRLGGPLPHQLP